MRFFRSRNALEHEPFMKYVYGVIETHDDMSFQTDAVVGGVGTVDTVRLEGLGLLVSGIDKPKVRPSRRNMLAHTKVLEEIMHRHDVLPLRFGTVIDDRDHARRLLDEYKDVLFEGLHSVKGAVEMGVKITWDQATLMQQLVEEDDDIRALRDAIAGRSEQETYYERIEIGRMIEAGVKARSEQVAQDTHAVLQPIGRDYVISESKDDMVALDSAYLVDKDKIPVLEAALEEKTEPYSDALAASLIGPVPPYNFVNLRIDADFGASSSSSGADAGPVAN